MGNTLQFLYTFADEKVYKRFFKYNVYDKKEFYVTHNFVYVGFHPSRRDCRRAGETGLL